MRAFEERHDGRPGGCSHPIGGLWDTAVQLQASTSLHLQVVCHAAVQPRIMPWLCQPRNSLAAIAVTVIARREAARCGRAARTRGLARGARAAAACACLPGAWGSREARGAARHAAMERRRGGWGPGPNRQTSDANDEEARAANRALSHAWTSVRRQHPQQPGRAGESRTGPTHSAQYPDRSQAPTGPAVAPTATATAPSAPLLAPGPPEQLNSITHQSLAAWAPWRAPRRSRPAPPAAAGRPTSAGAPCWTPPRCGSGDRLSWELTERPWIKLAVRRSSPLPLSGSSGCPTPSPTVLELLPSLPRCPLQSRVRAIAEIVGALVGGVKRGEDVDLNAVKREVRGGCFCAGVAARRLACDATDRRCCSGRLVNA